MKAGVTINYYSDVSNDENGVFFIAMEAGIDMVGLITATHSVTKINYFWLFLLSLH